MKPELRLFPDLESASRAAAELVVESAKAAISERGRFTLALSGGRTPRRLYELLGNSSIDWRKTHLFWGDERCVPKTDAASNYRLARETLLSKIPAPPENVHAVPVELATPEAAAMKYEEELRGFFRDGVTFDLVLLGLGPDGHTASLFPGADSLREKDSWVLPVDGSRGDPPVPRVTLTLPALNAGRAALFLAEGGKKRALIDGIAKGGASCPAALVAPRERLSWFVADQG